MKPLLVVVLGAALLQAPAIRAGEKPAEKAADKQLDGYWLGKLKIGAVELRLGVRFAKKGGKWTGTLDSIDQGARGLPIDTITLDGRALRFELKELGAAFAGKVKDDGTQLVGKFKQGELDLPITFQHLAKEPSFARPQEPKRPYPYLEEEVTYENSKAKVKLAGTLTRPKGDGPFPAVLLISGSGPQDRNEALMGHKPFLVLADHLTRRGIAVLRVDDRGVGGSTGNTMKSTTADFAEDALAGVAFLRRRKEIDPKQIGLLGHSEGGIVAPLAASQSKDIAFIVLLAGTAVPGDEILIEQGQLILKMSGGDAKALATQRRMQQVLIQVVKEEKDDKAAEKRLQKIAAEELAKLADKKDLAKLLEGGLKQLKVVLTPWFRYFLTYDPRPALGRAACPVLALFGEKDLQVIPRQNVPPLAKALAEGKCRDYTIIQFPGLNHLFQHACTGLPTEYGAIEETMAPAVLETIGAWILKRTRR